MATEDTASFDRPTKQCPLSQDAGRCNMPWRNPRPRTKKIRPGEPEAACEGGRNRRRGPGAFLQILFILSDTISAK